MDQGTERVVVYLVMDAVAGARGTPGRLKTGGVPPKPPATILLSLFPFHGSSMFWDFGSLYRKTLRRHTSQLLRQRQGAIGPQPRRGQDRVRRTASAGPRPEMRVWIDSARVCSDHPVVQLGP